jgi:hypothetical protein
MSYLKPVFTINWRQRKEDSTFEAEEPRELLLALLTKAVGVFSSII